MQVRPVGPQDYEEVVVGAVVVGLTLAKLVAADYAFLRVSNGPIRVTVNPSGVPVAGVPPAGNGIPMYDGDNFVLNKTEMAQFQAVRVAATSGVLHVTYYALEYRQ